MTNTIHGKKLVFLVGSQRSGTTWLHLLLSQSPVIAPLYETRLFSNFMRSCFQSWENRANASKKMDGLHNFVTDTEYKCLLRQFALGALAKGTANYPSASVILEKSPDHAFFAKDILSVFPDAYFLHIVRDPRAVVASLRAISRSWGVAMSVADACDIWLKHVIAARTIPSITPKYHEVRYEDLIAAGPRVLNEIFDWIGVAASPDECERYFAACQIDDLRSDEAIGEHLHLEIAQNEFFRRGRIDSWKTELSLREVALVEALTEPLMKKLEYELTTTEWSRRWLVRAKLVSVDLKRSIRWRLRRISDNL